jgi:hypothetical protein
MSPINSKALPVLRKCTSPQRVKIFRVDVNAGKNSMAAQMACIELENQLSFIALTG